MQLGRLNHVGIAVPDMETALAHWRDVMGARCVHEPIVIERAGLLIRFVDTPADGSMHGTQVELLQPLREDSTVSEFLRANPAGGQHHLCFEVPDIHAAHAWFTQAGKRVLGEPRPGAHGHPIFFVHGDDMGGVLTEILETPKEPQP
ncbi:methylmalonyl-CoA epimerase [Novosphingobium profundi]|uniref:methylmalonyl-CoA epimerase n=1 Tax=Novosphingobium profundi TaxID=1774954 RepID=UPI001BDA00E3|nr:methylmalonyl-CoA epimerase [Novosphingobium profundi]MBT0667536.1 methylmalonyl-CoA epimerase [Novosphingobium profundi]